MFEQLKQIGKLKAVQNSLSEEKVEIEKSGIKVVLDGNLKVVSIDLNPALKKEEKERILKECLNEGTEKIKASMAKKLQSIL